MAVEENQREFSIIWGTETHTLSFPVVGNIEDVKNIIADSLGIPKEKQKIIGIKSQNGKFNEATTVENFKCRRNRFTVVGTAVEIKKKSDFSDLPELVDDMNFDFVPDFKVLSDVRSKYQAKIDELVNTANINIINPLRGKKLLVLDLDNTLFDMKGMRKTQNQLSLKRPFTDYFLATLYPYYDFIIWSQTKWNWIEIKLTELEMLTHPQYKLAFIMDKGMMPRIASYIPKYGLKKHQIKPLELIWRRFEGYGAHNTVHVDDLARNFVYNPQCGLKCTPYKKADKNRHTDKELQGLTKYFLLIKDLESFEGLDHNNWQEYLNKHAGGQN